MKHKPNFSEAIDFSQGRQPMSDGIKSAHVVSVEQRTSKNGNQYLNWTLHVLPERNFAWLITMLTGAGAGKLKMLLECTQAPIDDNGIFDDEDVLGKLVTVKLKVVNYEGKQVYDVLEISKPHDLNLAKYGNLNHEQLTQFHKKDDDIQF